MKYIRASVEQEEVVYHLVQDTITAIYPKYYPQEVVDFFCQHHCRERICEDIKDGCVGVLWKDNHIIGTGCYKENHITRVYVKPGFQGKGYGTFIMQKLENEMALHHKKIYLDASLPACHFYENQGYKTVRHEKYNVENGIVLVYEIMEKTV